VDLDNPYARDEPERYICPTDLIYDYSNEFVALIPHIDCNETNQNLVAKCGANFILLSKVKIFDLVVLQFANSICSEDEHNFEEELHSSNWPSLSVTKVSGTLILECPI